MALSNSTVWEVRPGVGSDTNGGGFVAGSGGTDYSQQNSANSGGSNGSTTDAVGAGSTTITSATASFTAAIVGNIVYFDGQWYQVVSYTNSTSIVVDRNTTSGTGKTLNIGGALATLNAVPFTAQNFIWIKNTGTLTVTSTFSPGALDSSGAAALTVQGYGSTRGDSTRANWTTSTNSIDLVTFSAGLGFRFRRLNMTTSAGTKGAAFNCKNTGRTLGVSIEDCVIDGFAYGFLGDYATNWDCNQLYVINSEIKNSVHKGVHNSGMTFVCWSYVHGNGEEGIYQKGDDPIQWGLVVLKSVIYGNTGAGIKCVLGGNASTGNWRSLAIEGNAIAGNGGDGVNYSGSSGYALVLVNNILSGNSGYDVNIGGAPMLAINRNNAYRSTGSGARNNLTAGDGDVTLSGDPFTNAAGGDFSLNSTSGAGAACKAAGFETTVS